MCVILSSRHTHSVIVEGCAIPKILLMKRESMKSAQVIYSRIQSQGFSLFFEDDFPGISSYLGKIILMSQKITLSVSIELCIR